MKKIFLCATLIVALCLTGCGSVKDKDIRNDFIKDASNLKSYYMEGILKITNNDDTYEYDVKTSYKKDNFYKVSLVNKANSYEQIILKNNDGVYVITPSLNKSFKFQSDWPNNNSQSYLIDSVMTDLKNDEDYTFTKKDSDYVFTIKTNYPNNPKYTKQNVILGKDKKLKKVEVQDDEGVTYVEYEVKNLDENKNFNDKDFDLEEITKSFEKTNVETKTDENKNNSNNNTSTNTTERTTNMDEEDTDVDTNTNASENSTGSNTNNSINQNSINNNETNTDNNSNSNSNTNINNNTNNNTNRTTSSNSTSETSKANDSVFPLYLPSNTSLSDKEVINTKAGQRVIMTFSGDNPFILVQETVAPSNNLEIIPTYGEPFMLIDTVGSLTDTSYTWTSNGTEYYIVSDQMDKKELLEVAKSINVMSVISEK